MSMQSQISEKIRAMSEPNRKIEEETKEAEKKASEGYESEPQVEQVHPKKKNKDQKAKPVSVQSGPDAAVVLTGDMMKESEQQEPASEIKAEPERSRENSALNRSLQDFEEMLSESEEENLQKKNTLYMERGQAENKETEKQREDHRQAKTTVKESPRHKGYHAVHRRVVKTRVESTPAAAPEAIYCLYEPLTGSLNELLRKVTVIGKSTEANIRINNRFVSGIHARVIREDDGFYIEDIGTYGTGSTNGTKVNGIRIAPGEKGRTKLEPGDRIILANTQIIFDEKR